MSSVALLLSMKRYIIKDSSEIRIRPITSDDKDGVMALFNRLSRETRFLRYHYVKTSMPDSELECYCTIDYQDTYVLVVEKSHNDTAEVIGLGRYDRMPCNNMAEVSFLVDDKEQGKGICTHLIRDLADAACERGITTFVAEMLNENYIMFDIIRKFSPRLVQVVDGTSNCTTFPI
jgi:RimJ/RimL family protein N-acetyltransferase